MVWLLKCFLGCTFLSLCCHVSITSDKIVIKFLICHLSDALGLLKSVSFTFGLRRNESQIGLRSPSWIDMMGKHVLLYVFDPMIWVWTNLSFFFFLFSIADTLKSLNEKSKKTVAPEPEPEPTTEVLFLCSYDSCGKTFIDAGALRKHSHVHGEKQYVCHYEGCGKVLFPSVCSFPCSVVVSVLHG